VATTAVGEAVGKAPTVDMTAVGKALVMHERRWSRSGHTGGEEMIVARVSPSLLMDSSDGHADVINDHHYR
jgi:hypothetical protein